MLVFARAPRGGHIWWPKAVRWVCVALFVAVFLIVPSVSSASGNAVISVGDELQIDFLDDDLPAFPLEVGDGGVVQLPLVGALGVGGLNLSDARAFITETYIARGIYLSPNFEISFVKMRPLSVLGDVQTPGFYDYRPFVTVEQAIGLAGGIARSTTSEEGRSMQRAVLRGELASTEGAMTREAVVSARLQAQIAGAPEIVAEAVTVAGLKAPNRGLIDALVAQDNDIIAAERAYFLSERELLDQAITDGQLQIALTEEQIVAQGAQIASYDAELESSAELSDRGLMAAPVRARLLRQVADEETALLRLRTNLASARLQLTGLSRQRLELEFRRRQGWRMSLAEVEVKTATLLAQRDSVLDRIALLDDWSVRVAEADAQVELSYLVRRRIADGDRTTVAVGETDELEPGDVLIVRAIRPDSLIKAGVRQTR